MDGDAGDNAKITYALIEGNEDDAFIIEPNTGDELLHITESILKYTEE